MSRFDFDDIRESIEPNFNVIAKIELIDGVEIDLYEGSFQALAIAPDPDNGNRVTLWYTRPAELNQPSITAQLRMFMAGHKVTPRLHHYVGHHNFDGVLWFVYLDRTRDHNVQQNEMRSQLRQATGEINDLVERFLAQDDGTPDSPPGVDDFLRKLLSDINEEDE